MEESFKDCVATRPIRARMPVFPARTLGISRKRRDSKFSVSISNAEAYITYEVVSMDAYHQC